MEIQRVLPPARQKSLLKPQRKGSLPQSAALPAVRDRFESSSSVRFAGKPLFYTSEDIANEPMHRLNRALWDQDMEAFKDRLAEIKKEEEIDLNEPSLDGHLPLRVAVGMQNLPAMQALYDAGARPNHYDEQGETPLVRAITTKNPDVVALLLKMGADVDQLTRPDGVLLQEKIAPIHIAARLEDPTILDMLIKAGADLNKPDDNMQTALHEAADRANAKAVKMLLAAKADSSRVNCYGCTPLDIALANYDEPAVKQNKQDQLRTIKLLLRDGKRIEERTSNTGMAVQPDPEVLLCSKSVLTNILGFARKMEKQAKILIQFISPQISKDSVTDLKEKQYL